MKQSGIVSAFLLIAVVHFFAGCDNKGTTEPVSEEAFWQEIDAFVTERMNPDGSGYGILVVQDGEIIFGKGWGMANIADGFPFTPDTPIDLASLTKQFTAVAILILYERDSLDLDMKIVDHFPQFSTAWSEVTVHHLLTHQSGIPNYTEFVPESEEGYNGLTNQLALDLVLQDSSLEFPPGEQTLYSNTGYLIMAMLVEEISKMSYSDFLEQTIFDPLNMHSTFVHDETSVRPPNTALPYDDDNGLYDYEWYTYGAGGIHSTLKDMYKWDQALYTDDIIRQSTLQLATTGGIPAVRTILDMDGWWAVTGATLAIDTADLAWDFLIMLIGYLARILCISCCPTVGFLPMTDLIHGQMR
jgi:CubicO group peptidase (beta-lactamase class C family)